MNKSNEQAQEKPSSTAKRYIAPCIQIMHIKMENGVANSSVSNNVKLPAGGELNEAWVEDTNNTEIFWN